MTSLMAPVAAILFSLPAVLCGLLFLALFVAIWFVKNRRRRPVRKLFVNSVLMAAAVWGMLDQEIIFAEAQTVTATGDTASTNVYDNGNANTGDNGQTGENLWVQAFVSTTVTSGGAATVQAVLQDSADNSTFADVVAGPAVALAALTAGKALLQLQPPVGMRRYWRVVWRVGTAVLTAGKFDAFVSNTIQYNVQRPSGFTVA
jgi:hypothetical protein